MAKSLVRKMIRGLVCGLLVVGFVAVALGQQGAPPATILILRHAEKLTDGRIDLSEAGFARAKVIPQLFEAPHTFPKPDFIFATLQSAHSNRPFETIAPLAEAMHMPVNQTIGDKEYQKLADELLSGRYAGKVVLVAWHHGTLADLAVALGVSPRPAAWPDTQFDRVWQIDYVGGKATLRDLPQGIMPGDSK